MMAGWTEYQCNECGVWTTGQTVQSKVVLALEGIVVVAEADAAVR